MTIHRIGGFVLCVALAWGTAMGTANRCGAEEPAPKKASPTVQQPTSDLVPQPEDSGAYATGLVSECSSCGDCGNYACCVGPPGRVWFRADYLLWWTRGSNVPPLVTTSTDPNDGGILGRPTTSVLFGDERLSQGSRSNARLQWGLWLDCGRTFGIDFDLFSLGAANTPFSYSSASDGTPLLARPLINAITDESIAELVSHVNYLEGTVSGNVSEYFHSGGVNLRMNVCCRDYCCCDACECASCGCGECSRAAICASRLRSMMQQRWRTTRYRVDLLAGYRAYRLDDTVHVHEDLETFGPVPSNPYIAIGTTYVIDDVFRTRNEFNGGEMGLVTQFYRGRWSLELLAKIGFGNNRQSVSISGHTTITDPSSGSADYDAGILALETNIGQYSRNDFVVIPQFGVEVGYQLTCRLRAYLGYNFLYWANVVRAAEQIDLTVNPTYIPGSQLTPTGPERPAFAFNDSDFWAQGLNAGLELRF